MPLVDSTSVCIQIVDPGETTYWASRFVCDTVPDQRIHIMVLSYEDDESLSLERKSASVETRKQILNPVYC